MPRLVLFAAAALLLVALGSTPELSGEALRRIITIDYSGGQVRSANLRFGPLYYSHPDPAGIRASVSNLAIYAQNAELRAPEGILIAQAAGQRQARFEGGVRVTRGRLTAQGPELIYSEATGLGVIKGAVEIVVAPRDEGEEPALISASEASFEVDTEVSTSRGEVRLASGRSTAAAEEVVFEEQRDLAKLTSSQQVRMVRVDEEGRELIITADEIRVLTADDRLLASGNVVLLSGDTRSRGDTIFFDDRASRALILGSPAEAVNEADGTRTTGAVLEQRTDLDAVRVYSAPIDFAAEDFALLSEQN